MNLVHSLESHQLSFSTGHSKITWMELLQFCLSSQMGTVCGPPFISSCFHESLGTAKRKMTPDSAEMVEKVVTSTFSKVRKHRKARWSSSGVTWDNLGTEG